MTAPPLEREFDPEESEVLLQVMLQGSPAAWPFALGVLRHLCSAPAREDRTPAELAAAIAALLADSENADDSALVRRLCADPKLLASFFQNADLLPAGSPEAGRLGMLVMAALERLEGGVR